MNNKIKLKLRHRTPELIDQLLEIRYHTAQAAASFIYNLGFEYIEELEEMRIADTVLAEVLGYERVQDIRRLITRHHTALFNHGTLPKFTEETGKRGKPSTGYLLNRRQTIRLVMESQTSRAHAVKDRMTVIFDAVDQGKIVPIDLETAAKLRKDMTDTKALYAHERERDNFRAAMKPGRYGREEWAQ